MSYPIAAIMTDLDGTLLNENRQLSSYTRQVLQRCREKGILLWVATARPLRVVQEGLPTLPYDALAIHNGARIYAGSRLIASFPIEPSIWSETLERLLNYDPCPQVALESQEILYANFDTSTIWPNHPYQRFHHVEEIPKKEADKLIILSSTPQEMTRYTGALDSSLHMQLSERTAAMVMNKKAAKVEALHRLCRYYGIRPEQVAAFGDDYNDVAMIAVAGFGVAVENSEEAVKKAATYHIGHHRLDSVAHWLETYVL